MSPDKLAAASRVPRHLRECNEIGGYYLDPREIKNVLIHTAGRTCSDHPLRFTMTSTLSHSYQELSFLEIHQLNVFCGRRRRRGRNHSAA